MDLIIADFVTSVTTDCTSRISFSLLKMPLSLRVMLKDGRELTEAEKTRIPLIAQAISACRARASLKVSFPRDPLDLKLLKDRMDIRLGSESIDLFHMFPANPEVKASAVIKIKPWDDKPYVNFMSAEEEGGGEEIKLEDGQVLKTLNSISSSVFPMRCKFNTPKDVPVHVKIVVRFPECMIVASPEVYPPARRILEDGVASNVTIVAANGVEIKSHWCFLTAQSPVLMAAFQTDMTESKTGRLDMSDASEPGIRAFLRYLYYEDLSEPEGDAEIAFEILHLAHKYNVGELEAKAMRCLMDKKNEDFRVEVAFKLYMFIRNLDSESAAELKKKAIQIMIAKIDELQKLQKYRDLFLDPANAETATMQIFKDFAVVRPL